MSNTVFHVAKNNSQLAGTYSAQDIAGLVAQDPGASFQVWREGMASWADPAAVPEVAALLASTATPAIPVAASGPAAAGKERAAVKQLGFVRSLFDLSFSSFVTPKMIKAFYIIGLVLAALGAVGALVSGIGSLGTGLRYSRWGFAFLGLIWIVLSPVVFFVELALVRMFLEVVMVLFKIKENLDVLAGK
ncbi:MAG: DUF4282 domain-containing protein [Acidobacteria bacterium]|nr:DUF4282 domain-containing protein [Acidobacteriota bacterium]